MTTIATLYVGQPYDSAVDDAALERIVETVLESLGRGDVESPSDLTLLLRRYVATGRPELSDALGLALARALDRCTSPDRPEDSASEWLALFVEAAAISQDERLPGAAAALVASVRRGWPGRGALASSFRSIDACLAAAHLGNEDAVAISAIDELERIVGMAYEPGEGLAGKGLLEHSAAAAALLTAFAVAGRLPYAMLAEELIQFARRTWWNEQQGGFDEHVERGTQHAERRTEHVARSTEHAERFSANCEMARVLCRMAVLHADHTYRDLAVLAERADYARDARRTLERLAPSIDRGVDAALFAVALDELLRLQ